jgi:hypothetical protein
VTIIAKAGIALAVLGITASEAAAAQNPEPWIDAPPFSVASEELLAKAAQLPTPDEPAEVLLEEMRLVFDDVSRVKRTYHAIYRILTAAGIEGRSSFSISWSPWRQTRPIVRARVVSGDGVVHELDPATVADAPLGDDSPEVFTDRRLVEGPLPAVAPGSIVELEWTLEDTAPSSQAGAAGGWVFGDNVPVRHTTYSLSAPDALPLATRVYNLPSVTPLRESGDGRTTISFVAGPRP